MRLVLALLAFPLCFGCTRGDAPKTAPVKGTVTMQGKPLPHVGVTFLPTGKGPTASGNTNDQGEFTLMTSRPGDGAVIGTHKVAVGSADEGPRKPGSPIIPEKYGSPNTTDLTAEVKAGQTNVITLELMP
jgi:hypothetical protein